MAIPSTVWQSSSKISPAEFRFKTSTGWKNQIYNKKIGVHVSRALWTNFKQFTVIAGVFPIRIPIKLHPKKDKAKSLGSLLRWIYRSIKRNDDIHRTGKEMSVNKRMLKGYEYRIYPCFHCNTKQVQCDKIDPVLIKKVKNEILSEDNLKRWSMHTWNTARRRAGLFGSVGRSRAKDWKSH